MRLYRVSYRRRGGVQSKARMAWPIQAAVLVLFGFWDDAREVRS